MLHLMKAPPIDIVDYFESIAPLTFSVTVLRNRDRSSSEIDALTLPAGDAGTSTEVTDLAWPKGVISLSHIAVPFRSDDLVYGDGSAQQAGEPALPLGALAPRGEAGVLLLTPNYFLRARHNPFYAYQARVLAEWVDQL
jgi:hypothetical protein